MIVSVCIFDSKARTGRASVSGPDLAYKNRRIGTLTGALRFKNGFGPSIVIICLPFNIAGSASPRSWLLVRRNYSFLTLCAPQVWVCPVFFAHWIGLSGARIGSKNVNAATLAQRNRRSVGAATTASPRPITEAAARRHVAQTSSRALAIELTTELVRSNRENQAWNRAGNLRLEAGSKLARFSKNTCYTVRG
jgi:hypothetical protein